MTTEPPKGPMSRKRRQQLEVVRRIRRKLQERGERSHRRFAVAAVVVIILASVFLLLTGCAADYSSLDWGRRVIAERDARKPKPVCATTVAQLVAYLPPCIGPKRGWTSKRGKRMYAQS